MTSHSLSLQTPNSNSSSFTQKRTNPYLLQQISKTYLDMNPYLDFPHAGVKELYLLLHVGNLSA